MAYDYPPPAASQVLDLDFRLGASVVTGSPGGFSTVQGTGQTFDSKLGFNGNGTGSYRYGSSSPSWAAAMNAATEWTVLLQVRRIDVARSVTVSSAACWDSESSLIPGATATPMMFNSTSGSFQGISLNYLTTTNLQPTWKDSAATTKSPQISLSSHYSSLYDDPDGFIEIGFTNYKGQLTLLVDGFPIWTDTLPVANLVNMFIGGQVGAAIGAGSPFTGWLRRLRMYTKAVRYTADRHPKVAIFGDSFFQNATNRDVAAAATVSAIDTVQNERDDTGINTNATFRRWNSTFTPNGWANILQRWAIGAFGAPFRIYNAAKLGNGWTQTGGVYTQFPAAYTDAMAAWQPEIIITAGSVNDVAVDGTPNSTVMADIQARLTTIISANPQCQKILFMQTMPNSVGNASWTAAAWTEYLRQIDLQRTLHGFGGKVQFVPSYDLLGGANFDKRFNQGTYPRNAFSPNADIHPGGYGQMRIAEFLWPYVLQALRERPFVSSRLIK